MNWRPERWEDIVREWFSARSRLADSFIFEGGADAMIKAICEEIERAILSREEINIALMCGGIPPGDFYDDIAQAQLQKILTLLRKKSSK